MIKNNNNLVKQCFHLFSYLFNKKNPENNN